MKKITLVLGLLVAACSVQAATINLTNSSSDEQFSLTVNVSGVKSSVGDIQYTGLDGATTISNQLLMNQTPQNGNFKSKLIIVPLQSGKYNVTASANVDGEVIKSNPVTITVSDAQVKQAQAQIHQAESQTIQDIKTEMPAIKQEIQQQQQFINQLSNAINDQK